MQALYRDTTIASTPRPYLHHVPSPALNHGETEQSRDVIYLVDDDLQLRKEITEFFNALGMKVVTVKTHRGEVMRKMQAEFFAELVRMAVKVRIRYRRETQPGLERQSETSMFVLRNGSRSLAQVAAPQRE